MRHFYARDLTVRRLAAVFTVFVLLSGFGIFSAQAQFLNKEPPLWEGVERSEADHKNDKEFVRKMLDLSDGDARKAAGVAVEFGWEAIAKKDTNGAIRRFNQAWLIEPEMGELYWGLAVATHMRGDDMEKVMRWFDEAEERLGTNVNLITDRGRALEQRKEPALAKAQFERALSINAKHVPAHVGMLYVAEALEDRALFDKHKVLFDKLTEDNTKKN